MPTIGVPARPVHVIQSDHQDSATKAFRLLQWLYCADWVAEAMAHLKRCIDPAVASFDDVEQLLDVKRLLDEEVYTRTVGLLSHRICGDHDNRNLLRVLLNTEELGDGYTINGWQVLVQDKYIGPCVPEIDNPGAYFTRFHSMSGGRQRLFKQEQHVFVIFDNQDSSFAFLHQGFIK